MKATALNLTALSALCMNPAANAAELHFSYAEVGAGGIHFTFDQSSDPIPLSYAIGGGTEVSITNFAGNVGPYSSILYNAAQELIIFNIGDIAVYGGPQVYTGTESAPMFASGVFTGIDSVNGFSGVLTSSAVPEPATWAMMLVGVGAIGWALRRRAAVNVSYA